jgi:hypothetical protein
MSDRKRSRRLASTWATASASVALGILITGCTWFGAVEPERTTFTNETSETLDIYYELDDEETLIWTLEPGQTGALGFSECTEGDLVARRDDGQEVARRPPPLCVGDNWRIE